MMVRFALDGVSQFHLKECHPDEQGIIAMSFMSFVSGVNHALRCLSFHDTTNPAAVGSNMVNEVSSPGDKSPFLAEQEKSLPTSFTSLRPCGCNPQLQAGFF